LSAEKAAQEANRMSASIPTTRFTFPPLLHPE
jgi:hypothetical protein